MSINTTEVGVGWHLTLHFPSLPAYDYDFVRDLTKNNSFDELEVLADLNSVSGLQTSESLDGINLIQINSSKLFGIWWSSELIKRAITLPKKSIIVYCANPRDLSALLSALLARLLGKKVVFWGMFHSIGKTRWITTKVFKFMGIIGHRNFSYARTGAISQLARGVDPKKLSKIGTASKISRKRGKSLEKSKCKIAGLVSKDLLIDESTFVIAHVMRLSKFKNVEKFLKCCIALSELDIDIKIVVVGGGEMDAYVARRLQTLGLADVCVFVGPLYDEYKLALLYQIASVTLIATCIGLTAHQSLGYGVPIITDDSISEQTSEFEILCHNYNALIFEEENYPQLKHLVLNLSSDKELHARLSTGATRSIENYTIDRKVTQFKSALGKLCEIE